MAEFQSLDDEVAVQQGGVTSIDAERQDQNIAGITTPNPSELISDHSAEGADYLPAARSIPMDPPAPPMWVADHDYVGDYPAYDANLNQRGNITTPHAGKDGKHAYGLLNIGAPYLADYANTRHLRQNVFDSRGFNVNPADAPSADVQIWNSQHDTEPRWIGFDVSPLYENVGSAPGFSNNPGYLGVNDNAPNNAPRQYGSEVAQQPDDPYVSQGATAPSTVDYGWDF